jgi:hypothetical protein
MFYNSLGGSEKWDWMGKQQVEGEEEKGQSVQRGQYRLFPNIMFTEPIKARLVPTVGCLKVVSLLQFSN